jgi:tripartite-type tricarboxylate transporter receptor subunit TctC
LRIEKTKKEGVMGKKSCVAVLCVLLVGTVLVGPSHGKGYPTKPVELICPFTAGGTHDLMARLIAELSAKYLGQPMVVVNKPGAGTSLAAAEVINSKADAGYKIGILSNFFFATTVRTQKIPFDPYTLVPVANMWEVKQGLSVRGDSPWKSVDDLMAYGKKNPGQLKWGHNGRGITLHMMPLVMFKKEGVETVDVPYKGGSENLVALLGGHLDASSNTYGIIRDHVKAGSVRLLAFYSDRRFTEPANVPSTTELGYPIVEKLATFIGLYVHKDTPQEIRTTLYTVLKKISEEPAYISGVEKIGEVPRFEGPEFIKEAIKKGEEVGIPIIKEMGLYVGK